MSRVMTKYINWLRTEFLPLSLATPQATLEQIVENAIRYWNTHSGYKITSMVDYTRADKQIEMNKQFKTVVNVYPCQTTTWIWNDHPLWTLLGISVLDNVTGDLIMMSEAFRNYRIYVGTDMRWEWRKSEDPDTTGGMLYPINVPAGTSALCVVGTKRITADEDVKIEFVLEWLYRYSKALLKQTEGNTLRKVQGVIPSVRSDGPDLVTEGKQEQDELKKELAVNARWLAFAHRG